MEQSEREEIGRVLQAAAERDRGYASYFCWPDRQAMERGIVEALEETRLRHGPAGIAKLWSREPGQDPPDCEALDSGGQLVGIEVTELVDEDAIKDLRKQKVHHWANWAKGRLLSELAARITEKDDPSKLKGGPYDSYVLIIHCDEPALQHHVVKQMLDGHRFGETRLIDRAYMLLSYHPDVQECPIIELTLGPAL